MFKSLVILVVLSLLLGIAAWLAFVWSVKKGEFDDVERPKFRMLDDEPPPGNKERKEEDA